MIIWLQQNVYSYIENKNRFYFRQNSVIIRGQNPRVVLSGENGPNTRPYLHNLMCSSHARLDVGRCRFFFFFYPHLKPFTLHDIIIPHAAGPRSVEVLYGLWPVDLKAFRRRIHDLGSNRSHAATTTTTTTNIRSTHSLFVNSAFVNTAFLFS